MNDDYQYLSWLQADIIDLEHDDARAELDAFGNVKYQTSPPSTDHVSLAADFVNPADLHRKEEDASRWTQQSDLPPAVRNSMADQPLDVNDTSWSGLDEFLRSQGGWRPPVPCNHCKRLRLQCFMLQTTSVNPNPITSCSSCVALYRHCSLAGPTKRQASTFETPNPVIGQLHGVYEDEWTDRFLERPEDMTTVVDPPTRTSKRSSSRSNASTRPLRLWFTDHVDNPYPTECQKEELESVSGLSRTQIDNWFSNARRRKKQSERAITGASSKLHRSGSPMPRDLTSNMTPLERWQHSPPDAEPARFADIERAVGLASNSSSLDALQEASQFQSSAPTMPDFNSDGLWCSLPDSMDSSSNGTSSCNSQLSYASSKRSFSDTGLDTLPQKKRHQRLKQTSHHCPACSKTFTRRSDLLRHERAIHSTSKETWICSNLILPGGSATVWRISQPGPECALCGLLHPDEKHILSHEFIACADRSVAERTFTRKDHLMQHLEKFHRCRRKWEGWALDGAVERLRHVQTT